MKAKKGPKNIRLFFAILDGPNPREWRLNGKEFTKLMEQARAVQPPAVSANTLKTFSVRVEPIWSGPEELLEETHLDQLAGVIIEALSSPNMDDDLEQKVETLRNHILKVKIENKTNSDASFKRFGYSIWFMTDNPAGISRFVQRARDAASMLDEAASINHQFFSGEQALLGHVATYLSNIYFTLERGN